MDSIQGSLKHGGGSALLIVVRGRRVASNPRRCKPGPFQTVLAIAGSDARGANNT